MTRLVVHLSEDVMQLAGEGRDAALADLNIESASLAFQLIACTLIHNYLVENAWWLFVGVNGRSPASIALQHI